MCNDRKPSSVRASKTCTRSCFMSFRTPTPLFPHMYASSGRTLVCCGKTYAWWRRNTSARTTNGSSVCPANTSRMSPSTMVGWTQTSSSRSTTSWTRIRRETSTSTISPSWSSREPNLTSRRWVRSSKRTSPRKWPSRALQTEKAATSIQMGAKFPWRISW